MPNNTTTSTEHPNRLSGRVLGRVPSSVFTAASVVRSIETVAFCAKCGSGLTKDGVDSFPLRFGRPSSASCPVGGQHQMEA